MSHLLLIGYYSFLFRHQVLTLVLSHNRAILSNTIDMKGHGGPSRRFINKNIKPRLISLYKCVVDLGYPKNAVLLMRIDLSAKLSHSSARLH